MRLVIACLIGISLAAAPVANAALACQAEPGCCCCPSDAHSDDGGCQMGCSETNAAEQLSAAVPPAQPVRLASAGAMTSDLVVQSFTNWPRLAPASPSLHSPPPKRYLTACTLRL